MKTLNCQVLIGIIILANRGIEQGNVRDSNSNMLTNYERVYGACSVDGHYSIAPFTSRCFNDDWHTLTADHTAGAKSFAVIMPIME